jgi:RHS repeat-associated protein
VFVDEDGDRIQDDWEPFAISDSEGYFEIEDAPAQGATVVASWVSGWEWTNPINGTLSLVPSSGAMDAGEWGTVVIPGVNREPTFVSDAPTSAVEGELYTYRAAATDLDGDVLTYSLASAPKGMVINPSNGQIKWQARFGDLGTYQVSIKVADGRGGVAIQSFSIDVAERNSAPLLRGLSHYDVVVGVANEIAVDAVDRNGDLLQYSVDARSLARGITVDSEGVIHWEPTSAGRFQVSVTVEDGRGGRDAETFELIADSNASPRFVSDPPVRTYLGDVFTHEVTVEDADVGDTLTLELDEISAAIGMELVPVSAGVWNLTWTPTAPAIVPVTLTTVDSQGHSATQQFSLIVSGTVVTSRPPVFTSTPTGFAIVGNAWEYPFQAADAEDPSTELSYELISPTGLEEVTFDAETQILAWTAQSGDVPAGREFRVRVTDSSGAYADQVFRVAARLSTTLPPGAPAITSVPTLEIPLGEVYTYQIIATDPEDDPIHFALATKPNGMAVSESGMITWRTDRLGSYTVELSAIDSTSQSGVQSFNIVVTPPHALNGPPQIVTVAPNPAARNLPYLYHAIALDPNGDAIAWSLDDSDIPVSAVGNLDINASTGVVSWTPGASGTFHFVVSATDPHGEAVQQDVWLTVLANAPPQITSSPTLQIETGESYEYEVIADDANLGDSLTYSLLSWPEGMTIDEEGIVAWEPEVAGEYLISIIVSDSQGETAKQNYILHVVDPLDRHAPELEGAPPAILQLGQTLRYQLHATDADGDPLTFTLLSGPSGMTMDDQGLITWTPSPEQVDDDPYEYEVLVEDVDGSVEQTFFTLVTQESSNHAPQISSAPWSHVVAGNNWVYQVVASDEDGDTLSYSLVDAPRGMSINPLTGLVEWQPRLDQVGQTISMQVRVADARGLSTTQSASLVVQGVNRPPVFLSIPTPFATVDALYEYSVAAVDPDGHAVRYQLNPLLTPSGMTIDENTGVISWTPTSTATGLTVGVQAIDQFGAGVEQTFGLDVVAATPNRAPQLTGTAAGFGTVDEAYEAAFSAFDTDGDTITISATATLQPDNVAFTAFDFDQVGNVGTLSFEPTSGLAGKTIWFMLSATDGDLSGTARFSVLIRAENTSPEVDLIPAQLTVPGRTFSYDVHASDDEGGILTYDLDAASKTRGMQIDALGRISWLSDDSDVAGSPYLVSVYVSDNGGATTSVSFDLTVGADTESPVAELVVDQSQVNIDGWIRLSVAAIDNVGVSERRLRAVSVTYGTTTTALDRPLPLSRSGESSIQLDQLGLWTFEVIAIDEAGNISDPAQVDVLVVDPSDLLAPTVSLQPISSDATKITDSVIVYGSVDDDSPTSVVWQLRLVPAAGGESRLLASGVGAVSNAPLGMVDATILRSGAYVIQLIATDTNQNNSSDSTSIEVDGQLKLGRFDLSFTDLQVPLAGMPIEVTRHYSSLDVDRSGDFGYGWSLAMTDTSVNIVYGDDRYYGPDGLPAFRDGTRVVITLPDGTKEGFTFRADAGEGLASLADNFQPKFLPDAGVKSRLLVPQVWLLKDDATGVYYVPETGDFYTPLANGGSFTLRLRNGSDLLIDGASGELQSIVDRTGNRLDFFEDGIMHSSGRQVSFERDQDHRITAIIDPNGKRIEYTYDSNGDLIAVTDREAHVVQFTYRTDAPHHLDEIIDPLNRTAASTEYYEDGRIKKVIDSAGKAIEYSYDVGARRQTTKDQLGAITSVWFDARGNVIREINPVGEVTVRTFDDKDNLLSETTIIGAEDSTSNGEHNDLTTRYEYDPKGNRIATISPRGHRSTTNYDDFSNPLTTVDELGNATTNFIDFRTGLLYGTRDANGNFTTFNYDAAGNVTQITNTNEQLLVFNIYNEFGEITSSTPAAGRFMHFEYDDNGRQIESWYVETVGADELRVSDRTTYDDEGRVIATSRVTVIDSVESLLYSTSTEYNEAGQVTLETDQNGIETRYVYDLRGQLIETRRRVPDGNGNPVDVVTLTVYDEAGRTIFASDPVVVAVNVAVSGTLRGSYSIYDAAGRVTSSDLRQNVIVTRTGSGDNLEQSIDSEDIGDLISRTETVYGTAGRIDYTVDSFGAETHFTYNAFGDQIESRTEVKNAAGDVVWMVTRTVYDARGRVELTTDAYVDGETSSYATVTIYDTQGRVVSSERRAGVVVSIATGDAVITNRGSLLSSTSTVFDSQGRVARTISADGQETSYEYDILNRRIAVIGSRQTIDGVSVRHRTETHYNALGQVDYERDDIVQFDNDTINDSAARTTSYEYDLFGNRIVTTLAAGALEVETSCEYDVFGRKTSETDAVGNVTTYEYDAQGRLVAVELPAVPDPLNSNTLTHPRYEYAYDAQGHQTLIRDARGRETLFTYDEQGRQLTRTLPLGAEDAQDLIDLNEDVRDLAGVSGKFTEGFWYDDRGRQTLHVSFEGVVTRYLYDDDTGAQGRLVETQFFTDLTAYDSGTGTPSETVEYTYDAFGRQLSATTTNSAGTRVDAKTYYAEGRLATASTPEGVIAYKYDALGRKTATKIYAAGDDPAEDAPQRITSYTYDALSRLATVTDDFDPASTSDTPLEAAYSYDLLGSLDRTDLPNGVIEQYTYDELERLDKVTHYAPDGTPDNLANNQKLAEFEYAVRDDGKRTSATETFWLDSNSDNILEPHVNQIAWDYDAAGRLVQEVFDHFDDTIDQTEGFVYDLVGNRVSMSKDAGNDSTIDEAIAYLYDDNDRLTTEELDFGNNSSIDQTTTYGWNETQQASKTIENAASVTQSVVTYTYDQQGRMAQVVTETYTSGSVSHRERVTYGYDAAGIRVSSLVETDANLDSAYETRVLTDYLFDQDNFTGYQQAIKESTYNAETDALAKTVEYAFGQDEIAQTVTEYNSVGEAAPAVRDAFGHDGRGSVRVLFDATAAIAQLYAYDAYGQLIGIHQGNADFLSASFVNALTSLLYSGEHIDANIQQQYLRARFYDVGTGRFDKLDSFRGSILNPQSLHKYSYTHDDPITNIDPTGLSLLSGFTVGGMLGTTLRVVAWTGVGTALSVFLINRFAPETFARWLHYTTWGGSVWGPGSIDEYKDARSSELQKAYPTADVAAILDEYETIYPRVVSRKCDTALIRLMAEMKPVVAQSPQIRNGVTFMSALIVTNAAEPDNVLILVPNRYNNSELWNNLRNKEWYDSEDKKNIIFFYAGSVPPIPVGRLYDAISEETSPFGAYRELEIYPVESF